MQLILNNFLFIFLTFCFGASAEDYICSKGKITQIYFGKLLEEKAEYCYNQDKTSLISKSCLDKKCSAFTKIGIFDFNEFSNTVGNPAFHFCRKLGGNPEMVTFYVESVPYKLNRCLFPDGSFVNTGMLMNYYMQRQQN